MGIKTYEIFSETDSQVVQAKNMASAIGKYSLISGNIDKELVAIIEIERGAEFLKQFSSVPQANELLPRVSGSTLKGDWYCPECDSYLADTRVTFEGECDVCGTDCEWHDENGNIH